MILDANTTQIILAIIGLAGMALNGWILRKQTTLKTAQDAIVTKVTEVAKTADITSTAVTQTQSEITTLKDHVNGMKTELVASVKEAAGLAGEARGRQQIATQVFTGGSQASDVADAIRLIAEEASAKIKVLAEQSANVVKAAVKANGLTTEETKK